MNTQPVTTKKKAAAPDIPEQFGMVFPGEGRGVSPILVQYHPVPEPLLLRNHPTKRYACVYALIAMGGGNYGRGRLLSASIVDLGALN